MNWTISVIISLMETQVILNVIQIFDVLLRFEYLRWKFRLVAPDLWSVRSVRLAAHFSVWSCDPTGDYASNLLQLKMSKGLSNTTDFILVEIKVFSAGYKLFDKMLRQVKFLWINIILQVTWKDKAVHLTLDVQGLNYGHRVFDRGKGFQRTRGYSCFVIQWGKGDVGFHQMLNRTIMLVEKLSTSDLEISMAVKVSLALSNCLILGREGVFECQLWNLWYKDDGWEAFILR